MTETNEKLAKLAQEANKAHAEAQAFFQRGVDNAIRAGKALTKAKRHLSRGEWGAWLARNFEGSERSAQLYMRMAKRMFELDDETRNAVAEMALRDAAKVIAEPQTIHVTVTEVAPPATIVKISPIRQVDAYPTPPVGNASRQAAQQSPRPEGATASLSSAPELCPTNVVEAPRTSSTMAHLVALSDLARSVKPHDLAEKLAANTSIAAGDLEELISWLAGLTTELANISAR